MNNIKGYTLVELLVSIVLIGLIATFIFPVFNNIFASIFSAGTKTVATYEGQRKIIEEIQNKGEDGDSENNLTLSLKDESGTAVIDSISAEKRTITSSYRNPLRQNSVKEITIDYYMYYTPSP